MLTFIDSFCDFIFKGKDDRIFCAYEFINSLTNKRISNLLLKSLCRVFNLKVFVVTGDDSLSVYDSKRVLNTYSSLTYLFNENSKKVYDITLGYCGIGLADWVSRTHLVCRNGKKLMYSCNGC